jgi:hypothetical protein
LDVEVVAAPVVAVTVTGAVSPPVPGVVAGWFATAAWPGWDASGCVAGVDGSATPMGAVWAGSVVTVVGAVGRWSVAGDAVGWSSSLGFRAPDSGQSVVVIVSLEDPSNFN